MKTKKARDQSMQLWKARRRAFSVTLPNTNFSATTLILTEWKLIALKIYRTIKMNIWFWKSKSMLKTTNPASFQQPVGWHWELCSLQKCGKKSRTEPVLTIFRKIFYTHSYHTDPFSWFQMHIHSYSRINIKFFFSITLFLLQSPNQPPFMIFFPPS